MCLFPRLAIRGWPARVDRFFEAFAEIVFGSHSADRTQGLLSRHPVALLAKEKFRVVMNRCCIVGDHDRISEAPQG